MRRALLLLLALTAAFAAPVAAADGPLYAVQGGSGVVSADGTLRYVTLTVGSDTSLQVIRTSNGTLWTWRDLPGSWGIPTIGTGNGEGLSRDGQKLVLTQTAVDTTTDFLVLDPRTLEITARIALDGTFSFDALSPDASRLYLVQHLHGTLDHYVVRAYDLGAHRLLPGRIADRTQRSWVMQGSPVARTMSADGRWVYTLYENPGGYPFVHALDTVRGVAHCVGIPLANQRRIYAVRLRLKGGKLVLRSHRQPFYAIDRTTWHLSRPPSSHAHPSSASPWLWLLAGGAALAVAYGLRRNVGGVLLDAHGQAREHMFNGARIIQAETLGADHRHARRKSRGALRAAVARNARRRTPQRG